MRVLLIGSGGREHALAVGLAADPSVDRLIAAPGNPGIAQVAELRDVKATDPAAVAALQCGPVDDCARDQPRPVGSAACVYF